MKVLITGVAGHLGSKLAEWIIANQPDCKIVGIDNLSSGFVENVPDGVRMFYGDFSRQVKLATREPFDAVFHFAAFAAECLSPFVRLHTIRNVWEPTASLLNALLSGPDCGRLVFSSSIAVYGRGEPPFEESAACSPNDVYGIAKMASEHDIRVAGEQHGLDWCVVRPHNVYGPGQNIWDRHRNVFGLWMRAALEGKPAVIFGNGQQRRAFTYIDDILPCLWQAAVAPQASRQTINLGGTNPWTIAEAFNALGEVMGGAAPVARFEPARHEVRDAWCSTAKSRELLGYADGTGEYAGLDAMWKWAQAAWRDYPERRNRPEPFAVELTRGLPPVWATAAHP